MASRLVTVFGGSGFLGREIVQHLVAANHRVRVGVRHPEAASFLRQLGPGGRVEPVRAAVSDESAVAEAVEGAEWVINSVGHYVEKAGATFHQIHAVGARHIARRARRAGTERLVHISGLGAVPLPTRRTSDPAGLGMTSSRRPSTASRSYVPARFSVPETRC